MRLEETELEAMRAELVLLLQQESAVDNPFGGMPPATLPEWTSFEARVEFPLGELVGNLQGFAWAWVLKGERIEKIGQIVDSDRFITQGLEGKAVKHCSLYDAVIYWSQCPRYRCNVYQEKRNRK